MTLKMATLPFSVLPINPNGLLQNSLDRHVIDAQDIKDVSYNPSQA